MTTAALVLADGFGMHDGDIGWGWMLVMMLVFWGAVIFGIVWLIRGGMSPPSTGGDSAEEVLARRLAEGTISVEEYEERRAALSGAAKTTTGDRHAEAGT